MTDSSAPGAATADSPRAAADRIGQQSVDTGCGEEGRQCAECGQKGEREAAARQRIGYVLRDGRGLQYGNLGIGAMDRLANGGGTGSSRPMSRTSPTTPAISIRSRCGSMTPMISRCAVGSSCGKNRRASVSLII